MTNRNDAELAAFLIIILAALVLGSIYVDAEPPKPIGYTVTDTVYIYVNTCGGITYRSMTEITCALD